ncbi:MAG: cytochrome c biogenesis protein CcsA [Phycisphaerales bacterium]|nr:cytochrome c biogenesis protein CcsA [Phycisphaerales bacterium]
MLFKIAWWKWLTMGLLLYVCMDGFFVPVPFLDGRLQETIRNLFFHVPMWFGMMILLTVSVIYAIKFLHAGYPYYDLVSHTFAQTGILFGFLGITTGAVWAKYQWGMAWSGDPKQNGAALALLIYLAYIVLRGTGKNTTSTDKIARLAAVYNIFAFFMLFPTIWILPRLTESLHPGGRGSMGNPGLNGADLSPALRMVFWPAVFGWTLLGVWISCVHVKIKQFRLQSTIFHQHNR